MDRLATVAPGRVRSWCDRSTAAEVRYRSRSSRRQVGGRIDHGPDEPVPVADVLVPGALEGAGQRGGRLEPGLLGPGAEREGELGHAVVERELGHAGDVAGVGARVRPGHPAVRREVLPAVRCPHVADALADRGRVGRQRQGPRPVLGEEHRAALVGADPCAAVKAAEPQVGREERVEPQRVGRPPGIGRVPEVLEAGLDADDVGVVVGADPEGEPIARGGVCTAVIAGTPGLSWWTSCAASRLTSLQKPASSATMNPRSRICGRSTCGQ